MSKLPDQLKSIGHYIKIANEHSTRDPPVYYWCLLYSVQEAMAIDQKSPECVQYLTTLLNTLEQVKQALANNEAVTNDLVAQAHIEQYAMKLFMHADNKDRAGQFDKNVVKAFYTSGHLFDLLSLFGEMDENIVENRKYAKWKAAYIHNCLKNGETPHAGPVAEEGDEDEVGGQGSEQSSSQLPPTLHVPPPSAPAPTAPPPLPQAPEDGNSGGGSKSRGLGPTEFVKAQKYCKYAISALEYEDVPTAMENLEKAMRMLQSGKE